MICAAPRTAATSFSLAAFGAGVTTWINERGIQFPQRAASFLICGDPKMTDWLPIESAPRDKEIILAGQWNSGTWVVCAGQWLVTRWPYVGQNEPTHWQPLPSPPSEQKGEK